MAVLSRERGEGGLDAIQTYLRVYFAPRTIQPAQLPGIRFKHIYTGAMGNVWGNLIAGVFIIYFGNRIGMTPFEWSVMSAITSAALLTELVSAAITQRLGHRKLLWFVCASLDRGLRFIGIAAAALLWHSGSPHGGAILILAVSLATCFGAMAGPPWLSWLADIIPEREHGAFWGRRSAWVSLAVVATLAPAGLVMDRLPERHKMDFTMILFLIATIIGLLDIGIHGTIPEPRMQRARERRFFHQLMVPLRDKGFRPLLRFFFWWTFSLMIGATLLMVYLMDDLHCRERFVWTTIATTVAYLVGAMLTGGWSGRLVDRYGPKRVMFWGYLFWALIPLGWFFMTPRSVLWIIGPVNLVAGAVLPAAMNGAMKIQTRYPPPEHRAMFIAVSNSVNYIAAALASLLAGAIAKLLADWTWTAGPIVFNRYDVLGGLSLVARLASVLFLFDSIPDPPPAEEPTGGALIGNEE